MRVEKLVVEDCEGDYKMVPESSERYEVLLLAVNELRWRYGSQSPQPYVLSLENVSGMCGSGYTTASWGNADLENVDEHGPSTHVANPNLLVDFDGPELPERFECPFFGWTGDGGCGYYPSGCAHVHLRSEDGEVFFTPTGRGREKPMVHVFLGDSNLGKSTLGRALGDASLETGYIGGTYETDRTAEFQETMAYARVIVLGNKHPEQTLTGIREFFINKKLDVDIVPVRFGEPIRFGEED